MSNYDYDDDDAKEIKSKDMVFKEFQCVDCEAHNPYEEGFHIGDEITCFYCGNVFEVREQNGKLKFRAI